MNVLALLRSLVPDLPDPVICHPIASSPSTGREAQTSTAASAAPSSPPTAPARQRRRWKRYARQTGRPTLLTEEIADAMYEAILRDGVTDSKAGLRAKVSSSTVSRWKQEDPAFADFLETARVRFEATHIRNVVRTPVRGERQAMQKSKWLLQYSSPEKWGARPRKPNAPAGRVRRAVQTVSRKCKNADLQQSNSVQKCPETTAVSAAPNPAAIAAPAATPEAPTTHAGASSIPTKSTCAPDATIAPQLASESALSHPSQQSKSTPNCPESGAASTAPNTAATAALGSAGVPPVVSSVSPETFSAHSVAAPVSTGSHPFRPTSISPTIEAPESALFHPRQQSKWTHDCPETTAAVESPNTGSPPVEEGNTHLATSASQAAFFTHIHAVKSAHFHPRQQSNSVQNIPEMQRHD